MGGNDQLRQYYHVHLKSRKFYHYIFQILFEVCLANSYILQQHFSGGAKLTLKEFRLEVARGLIGDYNSRKRAGCSSMTPTVLPIHHFPVKHLQGEKTIRVRCGLCGKQNQWWCLGRSYVISYVARKPPFSLGRRGLAACACVRRHTSRRSDSLCFRKFSSLYNANAVSNICVVPHALMQTNIVFHSRWIAVNLWSAVHSDTRIGRIELREVVVGHAR